MKIVKIDNYNRESISDVLIAENVPSSYAETIVTMLNQKFGGRYSSRFYVVKPNDYKLYKFDPNN